MPKISAEEFRRLPLRGHSFLAGVPLHDAWAVDLPHWRSGITLHEFLQRADERPFMPSPLVRMLLKLRFFIGGIFGWDRKPVATSWKSFSIRLTADDCSKSLVPAGTARGAFRVIYEFANEQLLELVNRTVQGAALSALVETANGYRFYFGVYVREVSRLTPVYMALIDPVRNLIVYPSLLRSVHARWDRAFGRA